MIDSNFLIFAISEKRRQFALCDGSEARQLEKEISFLSFMLQELCEAA